MARMRTRQQQQRHEARAADPIGYAVLQSVEYDTVVHVPFSREAMQRYRSVSDQIDLVPERRDPANGELLALRSVIFRGDWVDGERRFCVRVDDVPAEYNVEVP